MLQSFLNRLVCFEHVEILRIYRGWGERAGERGEGGGGSGRGEGEGRGGDSGMKMTAMLVVAL